MVNSSDESLRQERMIDNLLRDDMKVFIPYLEDPSVTDIAVTDTGELIITKWGEGRVFTGIEIPAYITERIIKATAAIAGKSLNTYTGFPILEGRLPKYNARITGLMPPNCCRPEVQIRKPPVVIYSLEEYLEDKIITKEQYKLIVNCIKKRDNIIVSGSTGSGKTTMTNAIIKKMVEFTPDDNFYIVEDTLELQCNAKMRTMLLIDREDARKAVVEALRFSPDRIIFGEVRTGPVMRELLDAWRTGHNGNVTTLHATNGAATLARIKSWLGKEGEEETANHLSEVVQLIIHLTRINDKVRVDEIYQVNEDSDDFLAGLIQNDLG